MDWREYQIPLLVISIIVSPIACVEYYDMFMENSVKYLVFSWFYFTPVVGRLSLYIDQPAPFYPLIASVVGIGWVLLGLSLIPLMKAGVNSTRRLSILAGCFLIMIFQSLIVLYGFSLSRLDVFFIQIFPLPIPSLVIFVMISIKFYQNRHYRFIE